MALFRAARLRPLVSSVAAVSLVTGVVSVAVFTAAPASATTPNPSPLTGARRSGTRLPFTVSGTTQVSVDVATGNALVTDQLLSLPGVTGSVPIDLWYNSSAFNGTVASAVTASTGSGWGITGFDQRLVSNADGSITYFGVGGLSGVFTPDGAGGFVTPVQFRATLATATGGGWTLTDHTSLEKLSFNSSGRLVTDADRAGNATTYAYSGTSPASITSSRGPVNGRKVTVTLSGGRISTLSQASGSLARTVTLGYTSLGHLASVTDTVSGVTSFASAYNTDTGQVVTITNPISATTTFSFATGGQVSQVAQSNPPTDGGAGQSTTRLSYPSTTQTLVADPTTNQSLAVSAVPHTTYTIDPATYLVSSAQDADGNTRSATYSPLQDLASSTPASGGTTSLSYGANSGESLTKIATPGGASSSAAYTNASPTQYLPSSSTDDAGNALTYTYDGQGNPTSSGQTTSGPRASITYNTSDGTPATSTSPGASVSTTYGYDQSSPTTHDLVSITSPPGTGLGVRTYSWDAFGRLATASNGRGDTLTYTYDNADRITLLHDSNANTPDVSYTYDALNRVTRRVDGSGTTTYTYDDLGHLLTTANTAGGGTITYTYDLAGDEASITTGQGTTTYTYDAALHLTSMVYPQSGVSNTLLFANDANGLRTDAWLQSNANHTFWQAHEHLTYDASGRVTGALGQNGPASSPTTIVNETLCYAAGSVAPACSTSATADRSKVAWVSDSVTGETSTYTYDSMGRLTKDVITGGSNPRTYTYGYDNAGNRTSSSVTGTSPSSQALTFNNDNQISTTGYTYDASGDMTAQPGHTAAFNAAGQQTSTVNGGTTTTYTYAGTNQNELLSETTGGGGAAYKYTYGKTDSHGLPEIESVALNSNPVGYVLHDNTGLPVMIQTNSSLTCLYLYDGLGNPTALSTSAATTSYNLRYDPYGASTRIDGGTNNGGVTDNPYVYSGGVQDRATGQIKNGQRWFNPTTGGWTQQDNLNAPLDPANANRYEYAGDDPINVSDPTGRGGIGSFLGGTIGTAVAAFAGAAICAGTGGLGCILGAAVAGSALSTGGTLIGAGLSGESLTGTDVAEAAFGGAVSGGAGGAAGLINYGGLN